MVNVANGVLQRGCAIDLSVWHKIIGCKYSFCCTSGNYSLQKNRYQLSFSGRMVFMHIKILL